MVLANVISKFSPYIRKFGGQNKNLGFFVLQKWVNLRVPNLNSLICPMLVLLSVQLSSTQILAPLDNFFEW